MIIEFKLERMAKKNGGDRYTANVPGADQPWVVYFPQEISRVDGKIQETIKVSMEK